MIELHQFPTSPDMPNLSPFCMKVETWLKLAGLEYEIKWQSNPGKGPLGKLPFIRDGKKIVADSHNIIDYLGQTYGKDLDAGLSEQQRAVSHAFERMISEHLYWTLVYHRWIDPKTWPQTKQIFFGKFPPVLRRLVPMLAQKKTRKALHGHGLGRHTPDEILRRAEQDLAALAAQLGEQKFLMGAEPTHVDAAAYGLLANIWEVDMETPLKNAMRRHRNLIAYCKRMRERCFGAQPKKKN